MASHRACILFNWTILNFSDALLLGIRWLGCDIGVLFSESIYSMIANECLVFEREKE